MNKWLIRLALVMVCWLALPHRCPAPLVYRPGEGWSYEAVGSGKWVRERAKDQLEAAQQAFDKKQYGTALRAAQRVVKKWPLSDFAAPAQFLIGRSYEARRMDERSFKAYQKLVEKYPKFDKFPETLQHQYDIANRFLAGQWFKLWGFIPFFPSMDKTVEMYEKIVKGAPYTPIGQESQMKIGAAREKQKDYPKAAKAYEQAMYRYFDQPKVASEALFKAGLAYNKQAKQSEYDQSAAGKAISAFTDFKILYKDDPRGEDANRRIVELKTEQARGSYLVARFYERRHKWQGASIYYTDVVHKDPNSKLAVQAKQRIVALAPRVKATPPPKEPKAPKAPREDKKKDQK